MARHRLINCEFICAGSFKVNVTNNGKLLYLMMFVSADDRGFVDTTQDIINALEKNDNEYRNEVNLSLLDNDFKSALNELLDKGYIYEFKDNHSNKVHLIRHWFFHNKLIKGLWTNYKNFLDMVEIVNNEYVLKPKKPLKENNINQDNVNEIKEDNVIEKIALMEKEQEESEDELPFPTIKGE